MNDDSDPSRYEYLSFKFNAGTSTPEEDAELFKWLNDHDEVTIYIPTGLAANEQALKKIIYDRINRDINYIPDLDSSYARKASWWAIAAAVLAFAGAGTLYILDHRNKSQETILLANDIAPGRNSATLTLSNGKKIVLSTTPTGALKDEKNVSVKKTPDGHLVYDTWEIQQSSTVFNVLATGNGEKYEVILPDQTKVWLNAASSIRFPTNFHGLKERITELSGEAYFEVAKDKAHPFIVKSAGQEVKVFGTHFDINAYSDERRVRTILTEGSVRVTPLNSPSQDAPPSYMMLVPGEQALLKSGRLQKATADVESGLAWVKGDFIFNEEPLESVMRKISRWYNVEVIYEGPVNKDLTIDGGVSEAKPISAVLERIQSAIHVRFKVQGKKVFISP